MNMMSIAALPQRESPVTIHQIPNTAEPRSVLDAVHGQPAVQGRAAPARLAPKACTTRPSRAARCSTARPGCGASMPATAGARSPMRSQRQLTTLDYAPSFQMGHPIAFDFAEKLAAIAPRRARPHLLHQFRLRVGRYRAEDRAGLSSRGRPGDAHPPDRPRARLSRRRLRRHVGRRHGQQPPGVRDASARRRSYAPYP